MLFVKLYCQYLYDYENFVIIYSPSSCSKPVWVSLFFLNTKEDVLKNVGNQKVDGIVFHSMEKNTMEFNGYHQLFVNSRVSKWWQNFNFKYHFRNNSNLLSLLMLFININVENSCAAFSDFFLMNIKCKIKTFYTVTFEKFNASWWIKVNIPF